MQLQVLFYVLHRGGNILSRHSCEKLGLISEEFPKVGDHLPDGGEEDGSDSRRGEWCGGVRGRVPG